MSPRIAFLFDIQVRELKMSPWKCNYKSFKENAICGKKEQMVHFIKNPLKPVLN